MNWDPHSVSQNQLQDYRNAAEQAWGDDTRHPDFIGHPDPSAGQCFVTSQWLSSKLGGNVGSKNGHYFWASPDNNYVIDLTGDLYTARPRLSTPFQVDDEDEPYEIEDGHKTWRPGPLVFTHSTHPVYRDFRVVKNEPDQNRYRIFRSRANDALEKPSKLSYDTSGFGHPGSEPQFEEDENQRFMHDTFQDLEMSREPEEHEYQWVYANGQIHISPSHDHKELSEHAGVEDDHKGPFAVGYINLKGKDALWSGESNIGLQALLKTIKERSKALGWKFEGLVGPDGQPLHEEMGLKRSFFYRFANKELQLAQSPFQRNDGIIEVIGKTASVYPSRPSQALEGIQEWANDFGYRLAEYPGGGNMTDPTQMETHEWLQQFDNGDPEAEVEPFTEQPPKGPLTCPSCDKSFKNFNELVLHRKEHEPMEEEIQDGHFPWPGYMDDPIPVRRLNVHPVAEPLASFKQAARVPGFDLYASLWNYDNDDGNLFYGGFLNGQLLGYGVVSPKGEETEVKMIYSAIPNLGIGSAIAEKIKQYHQNLYTHADSPQGERLAKKMGMVNVEGQLYRYADGKEPKDMIQAPIPFIYDIHDDKITTGQPGQRTSDIMGHWLPGGIIEGYYEKGGKVIITTSTNTPYSTYHILELWHWTNPQLPVTSLELENSEGKNTKLASVGGYIKTLALSDPAAYNAYQALKDAGGKVYVVGGAVRDALLDKEPKDIDLMVSGLPSEAVSNILSELPGRVDLTGRRFGVYRYRTQGAEVEIALPREDSYESNRRGEGKINVDPSLPVEDDLKRRDFTANSMAVDLDSGQLIDPYGGGEDIEHKVLKSTHPNSFVEDPTRLIRALIAASRHGLLPDERTRKEMGDNAHLLERESPDALKQQLEKMMESPNPGGAIRLARETGLLKHMLPELDSIWDYDQKNPYHAQSLGEHSVRTLENMARLSSDPDMRLAALLHDVGKPASAWVDPETGSHHYYQGEIEGKLVGADHAPLGADIADRRLRETYNYPTAKLNRIKNLISAHMYPEFTSTKGARKFLNRYEPNADDLLTLRDADATAKENPTDTTDVPQMRNLLEQVRTAGEPTSQSMLPVNGSDIMNLGVRQGPEVGRVLRLLTNDALENPNLADRDKLLERATEYINEHARN